MMMHCFKKLVLYDSWFHMQDASLLEDYILWHKGSDCCGSNVIMVNSLFEFFLLKDFCVVSCVTSCLVQKP